MEGPCGLQVPMASPPMYKIPSMHIEYTSIKRGACHHHHLKNGGVEFAPRCKSFFLLCCYYLFQQSSPSVGMCALSSFRIIFFRLSSIRLAFLPFPSRLFALMVSQRAPTTSTNRPFGCRFGFVFHFSCSLKNSKR